MLLFRWFHPSVLSAALGKMDNENLHYRPLNGQSLKEIAVRKEHHGNGKFISPVGLPRKGRFLQLLKWKLSQNRFDPYQKGERLLWDHHKLC